MIQPHRESSGPLVSVLIPCYNAERWILQTLDSVLRQSWRNLEVLVVDDGSKDASLNLLGSITDPRMRVVSQENQGQTSALNRCLLEARGDFIQYLDADDLIHPEKIERQMKRLVDAPDCLATSEWARFYDQPDQARFIPDETWCDVAPVDWLVEAWRDGGGMLFPAQWLASRNLVDRIGPWREDLTLNNDAEYFSRLVLASERILFCKGAKAYYRSGISGSLSGLKSKEGWKSQWIVIECCENYLLGAENTERTRRAISILWQRFAHACHPYDPLLADQAIERAHELHPVSVVPTGGHAYRVIQSLLGWRTARRFQTKYYRWRGI